MKAHGKKSSMRKERLAIPAEAPILRKPKQTVTLRGKHASKIAKGYHTGEKISALIRGRVLSAGQDEYPDSQGKFQHHATIEMHGVECGK